MSDIAYYAIWYFSIGAVFSFIEFLINVRIIKKQLYITLGDAADLVRDIILITLLWPALVLFYIDGIYKFYKVKRDIVIWKLKK